MIEKVFIKHFAKQSCSAFGGAHETPPPHTKMHFHSFNFFPLKLADIIKLGMYFLIILHFKLSVK